MLNFMCRMTFANHAASHDRHASRFGFVRQLLLITPFRR
jgi:hypothetical protein